MDFLKLSFYEHMQLLLTISGELDIIAEICQVISSDVPSLSVQVLRNIIPKLMMVCYKPNDWWQWKEKGMYTVLELGGFVSQFATHFYRVANQFSKWFAVCESFYEGMDCIIHLLLMPATRNKPVCN